MVVMRSEELLFNTRPRISRTARHAKIGWIKLVIGDDHQWDRDEQRSYVHDQHDFDIKLCVGRIEHTAKGSSWNTHWCGKHDNHVGEGES